MTMTGDEINVEIMGTGGIICLEEQCKYRGTCANHDTAGDFRAEDGFSPQLKIVDNTVYCQTKPAPTYATHGDDIYEGALPENIMNLNRGLVYLDRSGVLRSYNLYDGDHL